VGKPVSLVGQNGNAVVTTLTQDNEDRLEGVPNF